MNRIKKIVVASAAMVLATGVIGVASAEASPAAKQITTQETYVQAFQGVVVNGENFAKNAKVTIIECGAISNPEWGPGSCLVDNTVKVPTNKKGTFKAVITAQHCAGVQEPKGQRCYLGIADPNAPWGETNLYVSTKIFVAKGPGI